MIKIMIIDQQPLLAKWLFGDLENEKYHIRRIADVDNIPKDIKAFMPDIILLDICFEGYERWDILHRIKLESSHIPVLIMSAYENVTRDPRIAEADGYIIKDIYMDKLEQKIEGLLTPDLF